MIRTEKDIKVEISEAETDTDSSELRVYELGFHIDPSLPKRKVKELFQNIKDYIGNVGTVIAIGEPHRMELAYTISRMEREGRHDFSDTFFGWVAYQAGGEAHSSIMDMIKEHNEVFRYIDIRTTKDAAEHSAIQHEELHYHTQKQDMQEDIKTEKAQEQVKESTEKLDTAIENAIT